MRINNTVIFFLPLFFSTYTVNSYNSFQAKDISLNELWLFLNEKAEGAEAATFDDSNWRKLDLKPFIKIGENIVSVRLSPIHTYH